MTSECPHCIKKIVHSNLTGCSGFYLQVPACFATWSVDVPLNDSPNFVFSEINYLPQAAKKLQMASLLEVLRDRVAKMTSEFPSGFAILSSS